MMRRNRVSSCASVQAFLCWGKYLLLSLFVPLTFAAEPIQMQVGELHLLEFDENVERVLLSSPAVAEATLLNRALKIEALQLGSFTIDIWLQSSEFEERTEHRTQSFRVVPGEREILIKFIDLFFSRNESVQFIDTETKLWAHGEVDFETRDQLQELAARFSDLDLSQVREIVPTPEMLEFEIQVVEVKERMLRHRGLQWSSAASGPQFSLQSSALLASNLGSETSATALLDWNFELSSVLQLLNQQGHARVLATPNLRVVEGIEGSFHSGGELPIPITNADGTPTIEFHPYGIQMGVTGKLLTADKLTVSIQAELSNLDSSVAVQGAPGLLTRRTRTNVDMTIGETMVISGLRSFEESRNLEHLPSPLAKVMGWLGRNYAQGEQSTELMIFLTPRKLSSITQTKAWQDTRRRAWQEKFRNLSCQP
ncbi:MAG: Tad secretion system secretin RcpA [Idiomarinaceae bacterium HL-53]|nr:MAG: Tad secretion system secretin RcpA [Idiomarinaceae bacterium HL-53]CUS48807.1 Flp pilus assembly protein, secretin CpaC [Idiomarinaceae bacterium HL-53]